MWGPAKGRRDIFTIPALPIPHPSNPLCALLLAPSLPNCHLIAIKKKKIM